MKINRMTKLFATLSMAMAVQTAFAGNITDINVSTLPDNQKIIKIRFDRDITSPTGFVTSTPAHRLGFCQYQYSIIATGIGIFRPFIEPNYRGSE